MAKSSVAKWHNKAWILGELQERDGDRIFVGDANFELNLKSNDAYIVYLDKHPLLEWYVSNQLNYVWPDRAFDLILKILEIMAQPLKEIEIRKALTELKIQVPDFKQVFTSLTDLLKRHPNVIVSGKPAQFSWTSDPTSKVQSRTASEVIAELLKSKKNQFSSQLRHEIASQIRDFDSAQLLVLWSYGIEVPINDDVSLDQIPKNVIEPIYEEILVRSGLPISLSTKLLFGLPSKQSLNKKLKETIKSNELQSVLSFVFACDQPIWIESIAKNIDGLWDDPELFMQVVDNLRNHPRIEKHSIQKIGGILSEVALNQRKFSSITPKLAEYLLEQISSIIPEELKHLAQKKIFLAVIKKLQPNEVRNLKALGKFELGELNALFEVDDIAQFFRKADIGVNYVSHLYSDCIKQLISKKLVNRQSASQILQIRPEILATVKVEAKEFMKELLIKDALTADLASNQDLVDDLQIKETQIEDLGSEIQSKNREIEILVSKVSELETHIVEYERSRNQILNSQVSTVAQDRTQGSIEVVRQWVANLSIVLKEFQRFDPEFREAAYERLYANLVQYSLQPIERMDSIVKFDPSKHDLVSPSSSGSGKVISPGWMWNNNNLDIMITKTILIPV